MIMFCEVELCREIVASGHMKREDLKNMIMEAFPQTNLKRVFNNGWNDRMTMLFKSSPATGKEVECFCRIKGFWMSPKKLKMNLVRWLYKNGLSTVDANIVASKFIPEVPKAYSTTPVERVYEGPFTFTPPTIEREVVNKQLGYEDIKRVQSANPVV
jgi:hypothetical protein